MKPSIVTKGLGFGALVVTMLATGGCAVDATGEPLAAGAQPTTAPGETTGTATQDLAYGTWGSFVGYGGRCLDVRNGVSNGGAVQIFNCHGGSTQQWTYANGNGPVFSGVGYAIGMQELGNYAGSNVETKPWGAGPSSARWTMPKGQFNSATGWCLSTTGPYNEVTVGYCGASATQWTYDESYTPMRSADGRCMTGTGTQSGSQVILSACVGGANQNWQLSSNGSIRQAGLCLDIRGGTGGNGLPVQLYNCNGNANQRWTISGELQDVESGRCLSEPATYWGPVTASGTALVMNDCGNYYGQTWEFRW